MTADFQANSRYAQVDRLDYFDQDGRVIRYLAPRTIPAPGRFRPLTFHRVVAPVRVDRLADEYYGDPEQYWRICDANRAFRPDEIGIQPGFDLLIPLPMEVSDNGDA